MNCTNCNEEKNDDFPPSDLKRDSGWCRSCRKEKSSQDRGGTKSPRNKDLNGMRHCPKCDRTKKLEEFTKNKKCLNGYERKCKDCTNKNCYAKRNPDETQKYKAKHYLENKDTILKRVLRYQKEHPEISQAASHKRRKWAKENGCNDLTSDQVIELKQKQINCVGCGSLENLTLEHIIPLSRGGQNTITNCTILCVSCNCSKQDKTFSEWIKYLKNINKRILIIQETINE